MCEKMEKVLPRYVKVKVEDYFFVYFFNGHKIKLDHFRGKINLFTF